MDEQRVWIKMQRKKRFRMLAVAVCVFVLVTTAFAGEGVTGGSDAVRYALGTLMDDSSMPISVLAGDDIAIDENNFPDENFRKYIKEEFDSDGNDSLSSDEREIATMISVDDQGISNLKGIEYFNELTWLSCSGNELTKLDMSNNPALEYLYCYDNKLIELNVSNNTELEYLDCDYNNLTKLDVSSSTALKELHCNENNLTKLDVSSNTELSLLSCFENNLTKLDVSRNQNLLEIHCYGNNLTKLDVSQNTALKTLRCMENNLTALDVSQNTALEKLYCSKNNLTALDVSNNTKLTTFSCSDNEYTVSTCLLDLTTRLPEGFELSKASGWTNAKFIDDNKILYLGEEVKYTYACGNSKTATFTLNFQPHSCTKVDARGACTEPGNIEYYECEICDYKFKSSTPTAESDILTDNDIIVSAVGEHDYGDWEIVADPSLTETGTLERVCFRDSTHKETKDIPALTDASVWTKDEARHVEPTEDETGRDVYKSDEYGDVEVILPKKEHTHIYGTEFKYDETSHWHECACKEKSELAAHEFGEWITDKEATESDVGLKHRS